MLPPEVTRIHMDFAFKLNDGHFGPRKFWQTYLPRLKYHNPAVPMTINRTTNQEGPAIMTIHFTNSASAANTGPAISSTTDSKPSSAPVASSTSPAPTECTQTINMKHRHESEILSQLMSITKAKPVQVTPEETQQIKDLEEHRIQSEKDSKAMQLVNEKRRRKEAMLAQARGEVAAARES